jgi:hypothetical protein
VIATENEKVLRVFDLIREQQADCLQRLLASIYIVAEEKVVCFGRKTAIFEES